MESTVFIRLGYPITRDVELREQQRAWKKGGSAVVCSHVYVPAANGRGDVGATTTVEERLERQRRRVWVGFQ
jgi:hypothetical protein